MIAGIMGLGLIGGSFAKAYHSKGHTVYAFNRTKSVTDFALLSGDIDGELTDERIPECDIILNCLYPQAAIKWLEDKGPIIGKKPIVIDGCGTKKDICEKGMALAKKYGFTFVGGHPMAGTQFSGYKYAKATLYNGAPMVIVPPKYDDIVFLAHIKELLEPAGFRSITVTTADEHDAVIAFTSQLAHIVSNAYVKSPTSRRHAGMSAGSYKDLTRVAWLNPQMWTELFLENKDNLVYELDTIIRSLEEYKAAIQSEDSETLRKLLEDGKRIKEEVDGK